MPTAQNALALIHSVKEHTKLEEAAQAIFEIVQKAEKEHPGKPRILILEIEGHRTEKNTFDTEMFNLQKNFIQKMMLQYLSEARMPLIDLKNKNKQRSDLPTGIKFEPSQH